MLAARGMSTTETKDEPPPPMPQRRAKNWTLVALVLASFAASIAAFGLVVRPWPASRDAAFAELGRGVDGVALTNMEGKGVLWGELKGRPRAVFFGFTHCPEVCPTTIANLSAAMDRLGPEAGDLRVDFVSVDPERDTASSLHDYLSSFGTRFAGYTGAANEIERIATAFRASYQRRALHGGDYTVDHTTLIYLLDRPGHVVDVIGYQTPPERTDQQLRALLRR